jgi:competence protein ComEC
VSDTWVLVLMAAAVAGAARPAPLPVLLAGIGVAVALRLHRPVLVCAAVALLVSGLAARSLAGLEPPPEREVDAVIALVTDPEPAFSGVRAEARLGDRRVEVRADGIAADALRDRLAGERITVRGQLGPVAAGPWSTARHLSGRLQVHLVVGWDPGPAVSRLANGLRRTLIAGAAPLDDLERSLYAGLVIGDDRAQPAAMSDDFQGAGLTHLLAVSGQNVAFVLVLAGPVLRRLRLWPRALLALAAVGVFGVMTRFEPSVLRASAMAALALLTTTIGSPLPRLRLLALAITGLLVVDPLLLRSVGFQLSTAAAAAIVVLARPLERTLPGPAWLRESLSVTVAAQLGVAPVLLATFGPLPVASFPANLLAVPVAGLVMVWGLTAGMVAGMLGGRVADLAHLPTRAMLGWLAQVASRAAALPAGQMGAAHLAGLGGGLLVAMASRRSSRPAAVQRLGLGVALISVLAAVVTAQAEPGLRTELQPGVVRWHAAGAEVVVLGGVGGRSSLSASAVLGELRAAGVASIDLLVLADASVPTSLAVAVEARHPLGAVLRQGGGAAGGGEPTPDAPLIPAPPGPQAVVVGGLEVRLVPTPDRLVVDARRTPS